MVVRYPDTDRARLLALVPPFLPVLVVLSLLLVACGAPVSEPTDETLRASFVRQIESIDLVTDLVADGDEIRFLRPDGSGQDVEWRVRIDSLDVAAGEGAEEPLLGRVRSAWRANGRPITVEQGPTGPVTDMPNWVLDAGLAPDCWALWDEETRTWGWT